MTDLSKLSNEDLKAEMKRREKAEIAEKEANRKAYEELKSSTVETLCKEAAELNGRLTLFKKKAFENMGTVYKLLQEYSNRHADGKGNFRIEKGDFRVVYNRQGKGDFDERADQAEKHIFDFVSSHFSSDEDTKDFIMSLLERKNGKLDIELVQRLYKMEDKYDDENWKMGISLLKESYSFNHSKDYINFYQRDEAGAWNNISLQFSSL